MSRTRKGSKGPGYDYWSKRPTKGGTSPGPNTKRITKRLERRAAVRAVRKEEKDL